MELPMLRLELKPERAELSDDTEVVPPAVLNADIETMSL
jgi:hypothetical protein